MDTWLLIVFQIFVVYIVFYPPKHWTNGKEKRIRRVSLSKLRLRKTPPRQVQRPVHRLSHGL